MKKHVKKLVKELYIKEPISFDLFKKHCDDLYEEIGSSELSDIRNKMCQYITINNGCIKFHKKSKNKELTYKILKTEIIQLSPKDEKPVNVFLKQNVFLQNTLKNFPKKTTHHNISNKKKLISESENQSSSDNDSDNNSEPINMSGFPTFADMRKHIFSTSLYIPYGTQWCYDIQVDDIIDNNTKKITEIYKGLASLVSPLQKSEEWHNDRRTSITASDGARVIDENPYEMQYSFVMDKVREPAFQYNENCYHGNKYEDVANMLYEYRMNVKVTAFGLIKHPTIKGFAASPDGIISPYKLDGIHLTKHVGRMLEIKCPIKRKIDKTGPITGPGKNVQCPGYYHVQVQLQLECCNLEECDFWQCSIYEYPSRIAFINDSDSYRQFISKTTKMEKGAVIQLLPKVFGENNEDNNLKYEDKVYKYSKFMHQPKTEMSPYEIEIWLGQTLGNLSHTHPEHKFDCIKYWRLEVSHVTLINRDRVWFEKNKPLFLEQWSYVEYFRNNKKHFSIISKYEESLPEFQWFEHDKKKKRNADFQEIFKIVCGSDEKARDKKLKQLKEKTR